MTLTVPTASFPFSVNPERLKQLLIPVFAKYRQFCYNIYIMNVKNTHKLRLFSGAVLVAGAAVFAITLISGTRADVADAPAARLAAMASAPAVKPAPTPDDPTVAAFQRRAERAFGSTLDFRAAASALESREALMGMKTTVRFQIESDAATGALIDPVVFSVGDHQEWITVEADTDSVRYSLNESALEQGVRDVLAGLLPSPSWATVTGEATDKYGTTRLTSTGSIRSGYLVDLDAATAEVTNALLTGTSVATVHAVHDAGGVYRRQADGQLAKMTLLAQGRSNYANSPAGRIFNIHKALAEQLNGSLVAPDATFKFNTTLKGASGWREALGIFEGGALRPVQGGGICQAATTLYRALVKAGLPVVNRAPHSLYVTYYKAYGVGVDATIFPGAQDLTFTNDTGHPILILSRYEGDDAYVELYGTPDGRQVALDGPYFSTTDTSVFSVNGAPLRTNEIGWSQTITRPDGSVEHDQIVSRYKSVPSSLKTEDFSVGTAAAL